jgi:NAD(P)-dependent dehydrogenase (short-subunit alcohol dehydrogenase family)
MRVVQAFAPNVFLSKQKKMVAITSSAGSFATPLPGAIGMNYGASKAALNKYMTLLAVALKPKGVLVELYQPVFVATKDDAKSMRGAAPVNQEVAKLIKLIDTQGAEASGKITNFSTGKIDAF